MGLTYLAVGDSITKGIGASTYDTCYINQTRKALLLNGKPHYLINSGVGGQTSGSLINLHKMAGGKCDPDLVTIMVGTNDIGQSVGTTTFKTNLGLLIDEVKRFNNAGQCKIILLTFPYRTGYDCVPYNNVIKQVGSERNIPVCDIYPAFNSDSYLSDGVHPNDSGHTAIANILIPFLTGLDVWNNTRKR